MSDNDQSKNGEGFVIMAIILLTVFMVAVVTYSAYLFIDLTRVPNIVGIHVTKNLKMAASGATGKLYSDEQKDIKDWIVYTDSSNGFQIKYPNDLVLQKGSGDGQHLITIKREGVDSLSSVVYIDVENSADAKSVKDELIGRGILWNDGWQQQWFGGKPGIRTGKFSDESGAIRELLVWQFGGKIFVLEGDCFNANPEVSHELFEKIVSEFNFII